LRRKVKPERKTLARVKDLEPHKAIRMRLKHIIGKAFA